MVIKNKYRLLFLLLMIFAFVSKTSAQDTLTALKKKRVQLEKEIEYTNKLISKIGESKSNTLYSLNLINNKITRRQELAATLKREVYLLTDSISSLNVNLKKLDSRLDYLKSEYARIAYYASKNDNAYSHLIFLFSSSDINQAYQRMRYLSEISSYIRNEAGRIQDMETVKEQKKEDLESRIQEKKKTLDMEISQLSLLQLEQHKKNRLKRQLSTQERTLRRQLNAKEKESALLNRRIEEAIAKATESFKRKNTAAARKLNASDSKLSSLFYSDMGKLPWPVKNGIVSQTFGIHNHPILKHVKIRNNGINIATDKGELARAVFEGTVVSVMAITSTNIAIIVKHGDYFTVFSGLDRSFVSQGDVVQPGKALGTVHTNLQGKTELHFELWKGKQYQNPAGWLAKKS